MSHEFMRIKSWPIKNKKVYCQHDDSSWCTDKCKGDNQTMKLHEERIKKKTKPCGCFELPSRKEVEKSQHSPKMNPTGWLFAQRKKK